MHAAVEKKSQRSARPDMVRLLARLGAIVALVVAGSLTGLQAASAAGATPTAYDDFVTTAPAPKNKRLLNIEWFNT